MMGVLPALNRLAHGLVGAVGEHRLSILIFHRVHGAPDPLFPEEPDAEKFDALLRMLSSSFQILSLGSAVAALRAGSLPTRALAITFDDGYLDNAEVALPLLQRHRVPATFFVSTGFLDGAGRMWNDVLIDAVRRTTLSELDLRPLGLGRHSIDGASRRRQLIDVLLPHAKYLPPCDRKSFVKAFQDCAAVSAESPNLMMTSAHLRALHAAGMEVGAHTISHPILTNLSDDECEREIQGGRERLEKIVGAEVNLFAYPNGKPRRDYDHRHVAMVKELGFVAAVSTAHGSAAAGDDLFQLPRYTPWGQTPAVWSARLLQNRMHGVIDTA
jgi:peptidoglycan/xylan/chitin deacetylase (PgdA/CDA1 family)